MASHPQKEFQTQAARIILNFFNKMMALEKGTLRGEDVEYLHDMRVASRRLRARMEDFEVLFPGGRYRRIQKQIRRMTRQLGQARDADVFEQFLKEECLPHPGVPLALQVAVARRREERRRELGRFFQRQQRQGTVRGIRRYLRSQSARPVSKAALREHMKTFARQVVHPRLVAVEHYCRHPFTGRSGGEDLHALRIRAKKLRYSMEIFQIYYGEEFGKLIREVRAIQDAAGKVHDYAVFGEQLRALVRQGAVTREQCGPLVNLCLHRRRVAMREFRVVWKGFLALGLASKLHGYWAGAAGKISG